MPRVKLLWKTLRLEIRRDLHINIGYYSKHKDRSWTHGDAADPTQWPWWRLFHCSVIRLEVHKPSTGYRLWLYGLRNARCWDLYLDRRSLLTEEK